MGGRPGGEVDPAAKTEDRVQDGADGVRQGPPVEDRDGRPDGAIPAEEPGPVRLVLDHPATILVDGGDMGRPDRTLVGRPGPAGRQQGSDLRNELRLDEQVLEGRMGHVRGLGGQGKLGVGGQLDLAVAGPEVRDREPPDLGIVLGGDDDRETRRDRAITTSHLDVILGVDDLVAVGLRAARLVAGGPDGTGPPVSQEEVAPPLVAGDILPPAGDGDVAPAAVARACRRHHHGVTAVGEKMRPGDRVVGRREATQDGRHEVADVGGALRLLGA